MKLVIRELEQVLTTHHADLHTAFQESIGDISNELLQVGIITRNVQRSPSYNAIVTQFIGGLKFKHTLRDLEERCMKFITALTNVCGPVRDAAEMLQQEWTDEVKQKLGIELQLS